MQAPAIRLQSEDGLFNETFYDKDRPYVRFDTKPKEDRARSRAEGCIRSKDVDYAVVTARGTKDEHWEELPGWWEKLEQRVQAGRYPREWVRYWQQGYQQWKAGQDIPTEGTPIKGWKLVPNSVQEDLIRINIRTVEDLAQASAEALAHIGMGAVEFKRRAQHWIEQHADKEGLAVKTAGLEQENETLKQAIATLEQQVAALRKAQDKAKAKG